MDKVDSEESDAIVEEIPQEEVIAVEVSESLPESRPWTVPESLNGVATMHEGKFNPDEVKFLVYGESGVGKTVFASTWPDVCFLDIDKGMASVKRQVFRVEINYWEDLLTAIEWVVSGEHPFKTVVLDSLNELQYLTMRNVVSAFPSIKRPYNNLPSQSDYGKMLDEFEKNVRWLRSARMNVVLIAQVAPREYETDPVQPQLVGKASSRNLCRMMDIVGYLDKADGEGDGAKTRVLTFDATNYVTKDRSDKLPQRLEHPTYDVLRSYWDR